jgi:hypothetical protein
VGLRVILAVSAGLIKRGNFYVTGNGSGVRYHNEVNVIIFSYHPSVTGLSYCCLHYFDFPLKSADKINEICTVFCFFRSVSGLLKSVKSVVSK